MPRTTASIPIITAKNDTFVEERESLRQELQNVFAKNRVDVQIQTGQELINLWIARLELRGSSPAEIESRFREITRESLVLTRAGFEISVPGDARAGAGIDVKTLTALANDLHCSGNILGAHHITVRRGHQYVVFKTKARLARLPLRSRP